MSATTPTATAAHTSKPRTFRASFPGTCAVTGKRFNMGAEIYKNPNGRGYVLHVVSAPVPVPVVVSVSALEDLYRGMDWSFEFSDSGEVHRRGYAALARISEAEKAVIAAGLLSREGVDTLRSIYTAAVFGR